MSDFLGIPFIVFSVPEGEQVEHIPAKIRDTLLGREYEFGKNDCYSLVRDYYNQEYNIKLKSIPFEDDWWEKGLNYFDDLFDSFNFVEVQEPKKGDVIVFTIRSPIPNHCGVYFNEGIFLHHAVHRLSCR